MMDRSSQVGEMEVLKLMILYIKQFFGKSMEHIEEQSQHYMQMKTIFFQVVKKELSEYGQDLTENFLFNSMITQRT